MEVTCTVLNKYGFHVRPSTQFMQAAQSFSSTITVEANGCKANAKSIMELMTLCATQGAILTISAEGDDAEEALTLLRELVDSRFGGIE